MSKLLRYTFTINLTQGKQALVDERDWYELRKYKWQARVSSTGTYYATRHAEKSRDPRRKQLSMHREILGLSDGPGWMHVDHINHNPLDNRRENLRVVTHRKNHENRKENSPYGVGVTKLRRKLKKPYRAQAKIGKRTMHLGLYATAGEAREARRRFLEEHCLS